MMQGQGHRPNTPPPQPAVTPPPSPASPPKKPKLKNLFELINFKGLEMDGDRLVIVALALILASEEADELLILALLYIML